MAIASVPSISDISLSLPMEVLVIHKCSCCCFVCYKHGTVALETKFHQNFRSGTDYVHFTLGTIELPMLEITANATDTYNGRKVRVSHIMTLEFISNGCCSTNPEASALVEIYRRPMKWAMPGPSTKTQKPNWFYRKTGMPKRPKS